MKPIIAIEGIDGAGKSLQSEMLSIYFKGKGLKSILLAYPKYSSFLGSHLGHLLNSDHANTIDPYSMSLWYACDRYLDFRENILNHLEEIDVIIFNRYSLSNAVYQAVRSKNPESMREWVFKLEHDIFGLPKPDLYLVLGVDVYEAHRRNENKVGRDYIDEGSDSYEDNIPLQKLAAAAYAKYCSENNEAIFMESTSGSQVRTVEEIGNLIKYHASKLLNIPL